MQSALKCLQYALQAYQGELPTCSVSAMADHSSCSDHGAGYEFQLLHVMHRQHMELAGYPDVPSNGKQLEVMVQQIPFKLSNAAQRCT